MGDRDQLDEAVASGILSQAEADAVRRMRLSQPVAGEEDLRFIRNFHDVFLAIGLTVLAAGLSVLVGIVGDRAGEGIGLLTALGVANVVAAAIMWGLAEVFSRRRRLFLPSIVISLSFQLFVIGAAAVFAPWESVFSDIEDASGLAQLGREVIATFLIPPVAALLAAAAFLVRFRLPFAWVQVFIPAAAVLALGVLWWDISTFFKFWRYFPLAAGLTAFAVALSFDFFDPHRRTRLTDHAFWLHFVAAPLILYGTLTVILGIETFFNPITAFGQDFGRSLVAPGDVAIITLIVIAVMGLVSLAINRRALLVAGLLTTGFAIAALLRENLEVGVVETSAATLIVLGAGVVLLGAGWHTTRRVLFGWVPEGSPLKRIIPGETTE